MVADRSDICQFGVAGVGIDAGQTEIQQLRLTQAGNEHVRGFQIAMRNAALEGVIEPAANIDRQPYGLGRLPSGGF